MNEHPMVRRVDGCCMFCWDNLIVYLGVQARFDVRQTRCKYVQAASNGSFSMRCHANRRNRWRGDEVPAALTLHFVLVVPDDAAGVRFGLPALED